MIVIGDITADVIHQEEVNKFVVANPFSTRRRLIPVLDFFDQLDDGCLEAGFFAHLAKCRDIRRLAGID